MDSARDLENILGPSPPFQNDDVIRRVANASVSFWGHIHRKSHADRVRVTEHGPQAMQRVLSEVTKAQSAIVRTRSRLLLRCAVIRPSRSRDQIRSKAQTAYIGCFERSGSLHPSSLELDTPMVALSNTTNFELPSRHAAYNMTAGPSCQPASRQSPQYEADMGQGKAYEEEDDDEESELMLAKRQECARRVSAWINQSAVRITAIASPYDSSTTSFDLLDLDLDLEGELYESNFRYIPEGEPYLLYSSSCHKSSGTPVVHAPTPRRSSRGRSGRRHGHGHSHRRIPSPLYVIHEEDSE